MTFKLISETKHEYRQIPNYPNYEVNLDGVVRKVTTKRPLKPDTYGSFTLRANGRTHKKCMKSIIDRAFHGKPWPTSGGTNITKRDVTAIKGLWRLGKLTQKEIGRVYNLSVPAVCLIVNGKRHAHV